LLTTSSAGPAITLKDPKAAKDPRFQKVMGKLQQSAVQTKRHPSPQRKAAEAQAAALPPAKEKLAGAQANQVDTMQSAKGKKPEADSFLTLLRAEIAKIMPKTLGDTENFMQGDQPQTLKGTMTGNVNQQKEDASGEIKAASSQAPDPGKVEGKAVTPLPTEDAPPTPPAIGATEAVPEPKPESEVSLQQSKQDTDQQLKDAEVTPDQLQEANDPRFSAVLTAKSAVAKQADSAPKEFRSTEQKTLAQEAAKAVSDEKQGLTALQFEKGKAGPAVKLKQLTAKQKDEARRKEVTDKIEKIYNETKQAVEARLASLENDVSSMFDKGIEAAMTNMKGYIDQKMEAYKDDRYGGWDGALLWASDKLFGMPDEVNVFYEHGRKLFMQDLDALIVSIAKVVETRLKEAKEEIAKGQMCIRDYVKSLPKDLQAVGKAAEKEVAGRFEEMSKGVDEKKNALAQKLAQRYKEATDKANEQLKKMQEENKGLVTKFVEKLGEIIKILREFKERISSMLKKGKDTIMLIVAHPIRFLGYLIDAIKQGIQQFSRNILKHLEKGLMDWLFSSLGEAGIEIPSDFSLGSILKLVLQVLGLTYDRIRAKAVKLIGERNVTLLEKAWQFISALIKGGPAALWEQIKEFLSNLKEMIIQAILNWVVEGIIRAAIKKLVLMFNPVGAIIGAIMAIYDTVMFFIERIQQILAFVEAIINSVYKIATGDISSAANWIEDALAKTIPIIISFLARLLGLTGIAETIKETIKKIQDTVDKAIDKLIEKVVAGVGKLFGKGEKKEGDKDRSRDVRNLAVQELDRQLTGKETRSQFEKILKSILSRLKSQGLQRLELGPEGSETEYTVFAQASAFNQLYQWYIDWFEKRYKGRKADMNVSLVLSGDKPLFPKVDEIKGLYPSSLAKGRPGDIPFAVIPARWKGPVGKEDVTMGVLLPAVKEGKEKPGGFLVATETEEEKKILLRTWNTGNRATHKENFTHAEYQFYIWLNEQDRPWRSRISNVDAKINISPCPMCVKTLLKVAALLPKNFKPKLSWTELFPDSTKKSLEELAKKWDCTGPFPDK
jgi:hypothetical protein